ncbi:MAG TPA: hypothetical protein VKT77_06535 [Chthonomonadaceae bacterium]|nr:hypothetical protein [Chthonomonadaceae bacterium]
MTRIVQSNLDFEREPLRAPFGFKGGFVTEVWNTAVRLDSSDGLSAAGQGVQGVLWSDPGLFASCSEAAGNATMLLTTAAGLREAERVDFESPLDLLDAILPDAAARGREICGRADLRLTFVLNALAALDFAAWRLVARQRGVGFEALIPELARPALGHRQTRIASAPAIGYGMPVADVQTLVADGFFLLKIKIGSDPNRDGDQDAMLAWDCARMTAIHDAVGGAAPANSPTGRVLYYLDANGRYDGIERVMRLLGHLDAIGALDRTILLEEPFPEEVRAEVGDLPVRIVADESAHTDRDVVDRIGLGYGAIAIKPVAKTLSMSFRMAQAAHSAGVACFCADLTATPGLVEWNKLFVAHLAPLPELGMALLETNGFQNYRNWDRMQEELALPHAPWVRPEAGVFRLSDEFFEKSAAILDPTPVCEGVADRV